MMLKDFNLNKKDCYFLIIITLFSIVLTAHYIMFNYDFGIYCSDVYVYLLNALYYTGVNIRSTGTIHLSPIICFLTSVFFRLGLVDKLAIYIVTGAFAVFGNIGFYILLKRYFDEISSLAGCIVYSSLTLYLTWLANGTLDIPAVSMIIWTVLFAVTAVNDNPKFYRYAILFLILGVFTRYTVLLTLPALVLYYIYEKGFKVESEDFKEIRNGIIIAAIVGIIIMGAVLMMGSGHFGASGQISNGISGAQGSEMDSSYNTDVSYYLRNFLNFISNSHTEIHTEINRNPVLENPTPLSFAVLGILIIGMGLWLYDNRRKPQRDDWIGLAFVIMAIISFTRISSVITTLLVLGGLYFMGRNNEHRTEYFMIAWIFSNMIFLSYYSIKVNRYMLPAFPAIIYFVLLSAESITSHVKINKNIIPLILIVLFVIQAFTFTLTFEPNSQFKTVEDVSDYIIDNNPDYKNLSIGVYHVRTYNWWLGMNLLAIESSDEDTIDSSNVTYYISNRILENVTNYTQIKDINNIYIYEKSV